MRAVRRALNDTGGLSTFFWTLPAHTTFPATAAPDICVYILMLPSAMAGVTMLIPMQPS